MIHVLYTGPSKLYNRYQHTLVSSHEFHIGRTCKRTQECVWFSCIKLEYSYKKSMVWNYKINMFKKKSDQIWTTHCHIIYLLFERKFFWWVQLKNKESISIFILSKKKLFYLFNICRWKFKSKSLKLNLIRYQRLSSHWHDSTSSKLQRMEN